MRYSMQNEFAIRVPLLTLENREELTKSRKLDFQEALCVSSVSLFNSYNKGDLSEEQKIKIEKYRKRMSNRTTPFGLAATQSFAEFQNSTVEGNVRLGKLEKFIRPDMEWLNDVIDICEKQVFRNLRVIFVNDHEVVRDKLINIWHRNNKDEERTRDKVQINHTFAVKKVIELARSYTQIEVIVKELMSSYPEVEEAKIIGFLQELLDKGYLWSDLRCYFFGDKQFELFLEKLKTYKIKDDLEDRLKEIYFLMQKYNQTEIGEGTELIKVIKEEMESIVIKKRYIHIDSTRHIDSCAINQVRINKDLTDFLEFLSQHIYKLSTFRISNVVNSFIDKYGDTEVPLEIFAKENNFEQFFEDNFMLQEETKIRDEIEKLIDLEKIKGSKIIDLEKLAQLLEVQNIEGEFPFFSELPVSITSNGSSYVYHLNPYLRSIEYGKIAGRFLYMNQTMHEKYRESFRKVEQTKEVMMIEPVFFPKLDLIGNVFHSPIYSQKINYFGCGEDENNSESYNLNDILIGVHADKLYFKSRKYNKRVHFINRNSANTKFFPKLIRFLFLYSEIYYENPFELLELLDGISETNIYMPRLIYKNIIISPEKWDIGLALPLGKNKEEFKLELKNVVNKFKIPVMIYLEDWDKKIPIDLENSYDIDILYETYKRGQLKRITEITVNLGKELAIDSEGNQFAAEYLFEFTTEGKEIEIKKKPEYIKTSMRKLNILDEWLYYHVYADKEFNDEIIAEELSKIQEILIKNNIRDDLFFIRYKDEQDHIRLRVRVSKDNKFLVLHLINGFLSTLESEHLINSYNIHPYIREVERYGGKELIVAAESFFIEESKCVIRLLQQMNGILRYEKDFISIVALRMMLMKTDFDVEKQCNILRLMVDQKDFRKEYQENKEKYFELLNPTSNWAALCSSKEGEVLFEILEIRNQAFAKYWASICDLDMSENEKADIILSVNHMFFNRFVGIDRVRENKVIALTSHYLYSYSQMIKHIK